MSTQIARQETINKSLRVVNDPDTRVILRDVNYRQEACMSVINLYGKGAESENFTKNRRRAIDNI